MGHQEIDPTIKWIWKSFCQQNIMSSVGYFQMTDCERETY
jgi:hypothetical protein